ncbi:MAG: NAD+ synthase [Deltaproteobacteria bacterium]|nr:NAD+ synthase [Deltaproteobacteria bacterium]
MKIALAQLNPTVGDISGNIEKLAAALAGVPPDTDLVIFSELYITGYPPRDLLEKPAFIERTQQGLQEVAALSARHPHLGLIVGAPRPTGRAKGKGLYNSAVLFHQGEAVFQRDKSLLPTYDVFDETRYFDQAGAVEVVSFKGETLGLSICEDAWCQEENWCQRLYDFDPLTVLAEKGSSILINISASPYQVGKEEIRYNLMRRHAEKFGLPFLYVNQIGGNDELIFDGRSMAFDRAGKLLSILPAFKETVFTVDLNEAGTPRKYDPQEKIASVCEALVLGTRDYLGKCGFKRAVVGLSGGVDSAVVCTLAVKALGRDNVLGVAMPSLYSSPESLRDSRVLADNLGIEFKVIPITSIYECYRESFRGHFDVDTIDVTLENIQARIRGNILMALSNKFGHIVLSTGNKSELAVGYCTLYGDMSGGLSMLADVPKTMVYELARYLNRDGEIIPESTLTKAPSAELRPDQKDQDTLPPYDILDQIIQLYLVEFQSFQDIVDRGFDPAVVRWVIRAIDTNEYKRRQAAPGLKITSKAFGMGRRIPIAAKFEI